MFSFSYVSYETIAILILTLFCRFDVCITISSRRLVALSLLIPMSCYVLYLRVMKVRSKLDHHVTKKSQVMNYVMEL